MPLSFDNDCTRYMYRSKRWFLIVSVKLRFIFRYPTHNSRRLWCPSKSSLRFSAGHPVERDAHA